MPTITRRNFLAAGVVGGFAVACSRNPPPASSRAKMEAAINAVEATRPHSGRTVTATLTAQQTDIDLGGVTARTLAYGSTIPGPLIRANIALNVEVTTYTDGAKVEEGIDNTLFILLSAAF